MDGNCTIQQHQHYPKGLDVESWHLVDQFEHNVPLVRRWLSVGCFLAVAWLCCNAQGLSRKQELKLRIVYDFQVDSDPVNLYKRLQDIYTMDPYGAGVKQVTSDHRSHSPAWSPDGKQIAFLQDEPVIPLNESAIWKDGGWTFRDFYQMLAPQSDLVLMSFNAMDARKVSSVKPNVRNIQWLPNAQRIALRSSGSLNPKVCVTHGKQLDAKCDHMDTLETISEKQQRGGKEWQAESFSYEFYPAVDNILPTIYMHWGYLGLLSRKEVENLGLGIAFFADIKASLDLKSLDGVSEQAPVAANDAAWSPDGKRIAYSALSDGNNSVLYIADLKDNHAGSGRALTEPALEAHSPVWSSDGSRIAFAGLWKGTQQIFAINADGTGLIQVSRKGDRFCSHPSWSPEGTLIVAECHGDIVQIGGQFLHMNTVPSLYLDISGWGSSIYLFDMSRPGADPRALIKCNPHVDVSGQGVNRNCGAHNPSFAPLEFTQ